MKYVEWPSYKAKMTVGVVNNPSLVRALQKASVGKKIHFKNVSVTGISDLSSVRKMDVLFFSKKVSKSLSVEGLKETNGTLIITEQHAKINGSVSVNFIQKNGSLQFELYNDALKGNGFKVSDQLKKLAILK
ncbi:MAG: YfiR family protein [Crocinitomicaceae bacterium]|nr:YfiR family protein [Crocinitomicaceae bacterium]